MLWPSPRPTLFPYTTLFRSRRDDRKIAARARTPASGAVRHAPPAGRRQWERSVERDALGRKSEGLEARSEEHTSELQSQSNLVCRLLLEKKNRVDIQLDLED